VSKSDFEAIPEKAIIGKKVTDYGVEALVLKSNVSGAIVPERPSIEDIILFIAKGDK